MERYIFEYLFPPLSKKEVKSLAKLKEEQIYMLDNIEYYNFMMAVIEWRKFDDSTLTGLREARQFLIKSIVNN